MRTDTLDEREPRKVVITGITILCVISLACVDLQFDDGREHFDTYEVSLPTDDGQLTESISVPVEDITIEGFVDRVIIVDYELRNPTPDTSVDVSLEMGLEGGEPEKQSNDVLTELKLEPEDIETDEENWFDPPPLAPELLVEVETTGPLEGRFDVYIAPFRP